MTMTAEQARLQLEALTQQVNQLQQQLQASNDLIANLQTRTNAAEEEHRRVHTEMAHMKGQLATGSKGEFKLIDPKSMIPEKLGSDKTPWKKWAEDTRAYVEMLSNEVSVLLKQVEGREVKLTEEELKAAAMPDHHAAQLMRYLLLRSEGNANTIVKASHERQEHPLET